MAIISLFAHCAPKVQLHKVVRPLLRLLHEDPSIQQIVLSDAAVLTEMQPVRLITLFHCHPPRLSCQGGTQDLFSNYLPEFYVRVSDSPLSKLLKLRCLVALVDHDNVRSFLKELSVSRSAFYP
jgi:hypothetical protein